jgi:hypothetical protein
MKSILTYGTILATLGAAFIAGLGTYIVTRLLDWGRRRNEARDISQSLYCEIADRVGRSLNDYLKPWRAIGKSKDAITIDRVGKFRPVNPVVYPGVAGKLGLLPPEILFPIIQFYFRLDAVRREIDDLIRDYEPTDDLKKVAPQRLEFVTLRFKENIAAGLRALEALNIEQASNVDRTAADTYPHVKAAGGGFRELLRKHQ